MVDLEQVLGWAHEAVRSAETEDTQLDFSRESVGRLERLLQRVHEAKDWDDIDDEDAWDMACRYGAYLGETMLRNDFGRLGFAWGEDADGEPCLKPTAEATGSATTVSRIVPIFKCFKRLRSGSSESVTRFYASCLSVVNGQSQAEILKSLDRQATGRLAEHVHTQEEHSTEGLEVQGGSWTFGMRQRVQGRRFSAEVPDQYVLAPDGDVRTLARYIQGIEVESECPAVIYSTMAGDLDDEAKEAIRNDIIPEARVQLMRKALYGDEAANTLGRVVDDWLVEGRNCQVIVFEVHRPSAAGTTPAICEYDLMPVAYDHEDFLRLTNAGGCLGEGQLKELALAMGATVELDKPVELRLPLELEGYCGGPVNADAFCECVAGVARTLNLSNNERMNANLWRAIRAADNDKSALLADRNMQRIQAEAYNAGLEESVTYYELFVRALEKQAELGTQDLGRMIDVVGQYADVFIVDYVTMEEDEEGARAINELGIISVPAAYEAIRNRWSALRTVPEASPALTLSSLLEAIDEFADSDGYCDFTSIGGEVADIASQDEVRLLLEQGWREGSVRKQAGDGAPRYAQAWRDDEWREVCDEENARFVAEQEEREKQHRLEHQRANEGEIAAKRSSAETIRDSIEDAKESLSSLEGAIAEKRASIGQLQEAALEAYDEAKSIADEVSGLGFFAFGRKRELKEKLTEAQARTEQRRKAVQDARDEVSKLESDRDALKEDVDKLEGALLDTSAEIAGLESRLSEGPEALAVDLRKRVVDMIEVWACPVTASWCAENVAGVESESSAAKALKDLVASSDVQEIDEGVYALTRTTQA